MRCGCTESEVQPAAMKITAVVELLHRSCTNLASGLLRTIRTFLLLTPVLGFAFDARAGQPSVTVVYSPSLDTACSMVRGGTIKDEWKEELVSRKAEFEAIWASVGPRLVAATESLTGKSFPAEDFKSRLTLCNLPSQSYIGISVNMRYALKSFVSTPVPMRYKVDTLFHELLHVFLSSHPIVNSSLLAEHDSEPDCTRNHLHLLALQKAVLLRLQEPAILQETVAIDGQLPGGCYKKAWAIVNATDEEYLKYVAEIAR